MDENREIPAGWKLVKLEEVVDEFVRGPFGGSLKKECFVPNGYKVYEQKNAIYQSAELGEYFINENKYQELIRFEVKPNDFIVSCSGTIGKLFMIPEKSPRGIINQALLIIRINRDFLLNKFFMYLFTSSVFQRLIINDAKGTAMLNLAGVKDMKLVPVLLPPIPEQRAIVTKIEELFSRLDKGIESLKTAQQQLKIYRQAVLKWAFEGKLTEQWRISNPYTERYLVELTEKIQMFNSKKDGQDIPRRLPPMNLENIFDIPFGWNWFESHKICSSVRDGTHDTPKYVEKGIPLITSKNLKNGILDYSNIDYISEQDHFEISKRSAVDIDDILFGMIGTIGNPVLIVNNSHFSIKNVGIFKKNENLIIPKYLKYWLQSLSCERILKENDLIKGTTQKFISLGGLRVLPIPLPCKEEQTQIVQEIESRLSVCDKIEESIEHSLKQSEALRQSILKKAFEGKLVPQDPNDEPASVLLERIKAETEKNKPENPPHRQAGKQAKKAKS